MAKAKTKAAGTNLRVPQSDAEAEQMIAELGASLRDHTEATAHHDAQVAALKEGHGERDRAFKEAQKALHGGLAIWASANRERLTNGGRSKTFHFASGSISWQDGRHSVAHRPLKLDEVVEAIRARIAEVEEARLQAKRERRNVEAARMLATREILEGFLRVKFEPNKDAMITYREVAETIRGVTVPRGPEEFVVKPAASQISEVA